MEPTAPQTTHCPVCDEKIRTTCAQNEVPFYRITKTTQCRCWTNTYTATYDTMAIERPDFFEVMHARAALTVQRQRVYANAFLNLQAGWKMATARDVVDAIHRPPATTIQRAAEALADGLATLCDPLRVPCARCGLPIEHGLGWCGMCLAHFNATHESMARTIGAGKLLPRPGAIVLAVDDPNGDDVGEDV